MLSTRGNRKYAILLVRLEIAAAAAAAICTVLTKGSVQSDAPRYNDTLHSVRHNRILCITSRSITRTLTTTMIAMARRRFGTDKTNFHIIVAPKTVDLVVHHIGAAGIGFVNLRIVVAVVVLSV